MDIVIYQQDGATSHCSNALLEYLHRYFPETGSSPVVRIQPWPTHSPELTPLDYFLWKCLQDRVYANNPQTAGDALKNNIRREIRGIPPVRGNNLHHTKLTSL